MATSTSVMPDTAALFRQRKVNLPTSLDPSKSANYNPPIKELRGGHRPAPFTQGTIGESLASQSGAARGPCSVRSLGWSIDARRLASSSSDRTIRIWTPELSVDARATTELLGHTDGIEQLAWSPVHVDSLASASGDKSVRLWDTRTSKETHRIETPGSNINIAHHPQGTYIAVGDRVDNISIIDVRTGKILGSARSQGRPLDATAKKWIDDEQEEINEMSWTPDGSVFVMGTGSGKVRVLDARNLATTDVDDQNSVSTITSALHWPVVHTIAGHTASVFCVRMDPLGRYLATASADGTTAIWSLDEWFNISMSGHHSYAPRSISFSHNGEFLAAAGEDPFICVTAVAPMHPTNIESPLRKISINAPVNAVAWHPSRPALAYAGDDREGTIRIWGLN